MEIEDWRELKSQLDRLERLIFRLKSPLSMVAFAIHWLFAFSLFFGLPLLWRLLISAVVASLGAWSVSREFKTPK